MKKLRILPVFISMVLLLSLMFLTNNVFAADHIDLGDAENFAVLAGSAITNTLATTITGDAGSSPTSTETGFGSVTFIEGVNHIAPAPNDSLTVSAKTDLTTAYNIAAAASTTETFGSAELGGKTLIPGVYKTTTGTMGITGTLTLDGGGDPNAVFIFQAGSTLTTASGSTVVLTGGAQACNVYWQVGSSATLGTGSTFVGNILAAQSITDNGGSTIYGSFLASNAAVTLNNTNITRQICAPIVTKSFSPTEIEITSPLASSRLTITISSITNITSKRNLTAAFTDILPTDLEIAATPNLATTCGDLGPLTATAGTSSITMPTGYNFSGTSTSCKITVDVTSSIAGSYINRIENGGLQTDFGDNLIPASATLLVTDSRKAFSTITTSLSDSDITAGGEVYDTALLAETSSIAPAAGTVIYTVFTDDVCSLIAHEAGAVTLLSNGEVPDSDSVTFDAVGTYYWQAVYSGDDYNNGAISDCTSEILTVGASISPTPTPGPTLIPGQTLTPGQTMVPGLTPIPGLTPGPEDTTSSTRISKVLPNTGFPPDRITLLSLQPAQKAYTDLGLLWLEIPSLSVDIPIVGIPQQADGEWDVSWLNNQAGWLNSTAFPTLAGNSVLTGHVVDAKGKPGPFIGLYGLSWGDEVIIHAWGSQYKYEVRQVSQVKPEDIATVLKHEDLPYITLITCRGYDEADNSYKYRVVVRAVQVEFE